MSQKRKAKHKMSNCFLFGAGFSHAISGRKAPLTKTLGEEISKKIPIEIKKKLDFEPDLLEVFMTQLDLSRKEDEVKCKQQIREFLRARLSINQIQDSNCQVGSGFVDTLGQDDVLLSLNYDCLLDQILCLQKVWHPNGGYSNFVEDRGLALRNGPHNKSFRNILLLKLHGSLNFIEHYGVDEKDEYDREHSFIDIEINSEVFPNLNLNRGILPDAIKGEHLIALSYMKVFHPQVLSLWNLAFGKFRETFFDKFVIIGCSVRPEDTLLHLLLLNIQCNKIIVVDPAHKEIVVRLFRLCRAPNSFRIEADKWEVRDDLEHYLAVEKLTAPL